MYKALMPKPHIKHRIREARLAAKLTQEQLADRFGISPQAAQQWETGRSKPALERIPELAALLGVSPLWLAWGIGLREQIEHGTIPALIQPLGGRIVPSINYMDAAQDLEAARETADEQAVAHFPCSEDAFRILVWDRSNSPTYDVGHSLIIDPAVKPRPEAMVFAVSGPERVPIFGQLRIGRHDGGLKYTIVPLNAAWPEHDVTPDQIIGVESEHAYRRS